MSDSNNGLSRRAFIAGSTLMIVPRHVLGGRGYTAPSDKITLASIGMGRQGTVVTMDFLERPDVQVVAVCDCNRQSKDYAEYSPNAMVNQARHVIGDNTWGEDLKSPGFAQLTHNFKTSLGFGGREPAKRLVEAYYGKRHPSGSYKGCNAYTDFRELLEKEKDLDAVYVATPDHWHAPISITAMRKGKHVLCQKPMTHSVAEARKMAQVARETKVATSIVVNNAASDETRLLTDWIREGAIGKVREVHLWSMRPYWPQGIARPTDEEQAPENLDWNMWLGPAPYRPYNKIYQPFSWRGWYDFGNGALGDMGCYAMAGIWNILNLDIPTAVETSASDAGAPYEETFPFASLVHLYFPQRGDNGPVRLNWYDGGLRPPRPENLPEGTRFGNGEGEGTLYVGDKGYILAGFNGENPVLVPASSNFQPPPRKQGREGYYLYDQWIGACKGGPQSPASFINEAPVTESFLLGNLALRRSGRKLLWDPAAMKFTNDDKANAYVDPPYREGFKLI